MPAACASPLSVRPWSSRAARTRSPTRVAGSSMARLYRLVPYTERDRYVLYMEHASHADRHAIVAGVVAALVGFTSSFAVVLAGLRAAGASPAQAASGLLAVTVTMAVAT